MNCTLMLYLGIDSMKGIFYDDKGNEIEAFKMPLSLKAEGDYMEQNPEEWIDGVSEIIREMKYKNRDLSIQYMSVIYQPGTFVFVDRAGKNIMGAIMPGDKRAKYQSEICEKMFKKQGSSLYAPWNSLVYPIILWIKYNKPDAYKRIYKILTPDGYISYRLCGETAIDVYSAAFLGYSIKNNDYNNKIINSLEIEKGIFPRVCKIGECVGVIDGEAKEELGLNTDLKLLMGSGIMLPMAMLLSRKGIKGMVFDSDTFNICFVSDNSKIRKHSFITKIPFKDNSYINFIKGNYQIQFLKWIKEITKEENTEDINYALGSSGVIILPEIFGEWEHDYCDLRGGVLGIQRNTCIDDIITSFYEAAGFTLKSSIEHNFSDEMQVDYIEVIGTERDKLLCRVLSNVNSVKVFMGNSHNDIIKEAFYMVKDMPRQDYDDRFEMVPEEEMSSNYKRLYSLHHGVRNSLKDIYKLRRKLLRRTDIKQ
ncbi:FGGY family carbohydrate kinase [Oxobacter pfennigii]|nr:FGGY family carbohydrate kinase [Oxobacter pfennigii]